jgi:putative oxidoreductase
MGLSIVHEGEQSYSVYPDYQLPGTPYIFPTQRRMFRRRKPDQETDMNASRNTDYGIAVLRVSLGIMFIAHSVVLKYFTFGLAGTAQFFETIGLPGFLAYVVFGMEAVGGILLVLGVRTREVTAALLPILVGALWVHSGNGWVFSGANGGWEYPLYLVVLSIAQVLLGEGAFALSRTTARTGRIVAQQTPA